MASMKTGFSIGIIIGLQKGQSKIILAGRLREFGFQATRLNQKFFGGFAHERGRGSGWNLRGFASEKSEPLVLKILVDFVLSLPRLSVEFLDRQILVPSLGECRNGTDQNAKRDESTDPSRHWH
jgi:hypothetical protein